jgi:hypothetical protein
MSVKETASSVAVDNDGTFEGFNMEVEVVECAPGESSPSAKGSAPKCVLSPSASVPSPKGKGKAKDSEEELEDVEDENVCLREENACLCVCIGIRSCVLGTEVGGGAFAGSTNCPASYTCMYRYGS